MAGRSMYSSVRIAVHNFTTVCKFSEAVFSKRPSVAAMRKGGDSVELSVGIAGNCCCDCTGKLLLEGQEQQLLLLILLLLLLLLLINCCCYYYTHY